MNEKVKKDSSQIEWAKERYYVINETASGKPRVVVCLIEDLDGNYSRGVAVCSPSDKFKLDIGKEWSYGYAVDALSERSNLNDIRRKVCVQMLSKSNAEFDNHSYFKPSLSLYEKGIFESIITS